MVSQKDILIALAREGGAVILNGYQVFAKYPDGTMKVISAIMYPMKEDKMPSRASIVAKQNVPTKEFKVSSEEIDI